MDILTYVHDAVLPAAERLLPPAMASTEARALLLAIGLQESRFGARRQRGGPARGFWQFEAGGVEGVLLHPTTHLKIAVALRTLQYDHTVDAADLLPALEHNDVLAACFARCLLWTLPAALPGPNDAAAAWVAYTQTWRPGAPRRETWDGVHRQAWELVLDGRVPPAVLQA